MTAPSPHHQPARLVVLALRTFPKRWRAANGDEMLQTAGELRTSGWWSPLGQALDVAVAGLDVRWHDRPPMRHRIAYRFMNKPVPEAWHPWMRDDLSSRFVGIRTMFYVLVPMYSFLIWQIVEFDQVAIGWAAAVFYAVLIVAGAPFKNRQIRRRIYENLGWARDGTPLPPPNPHTRTTSGPSA